MSLGDFFNKSGYFPYDATDNFMDLCSMPENQSRISYNFQNNIWLCSMYCVGVVLHDFLRQYS